jgi:NAD/NADP transhydrogenase alpha subunit
MLEFDSSSNRSTDLGLGSRSPEKESEEFKQMKSNRIGVDSLDELRAAIDKLGARNSDMMAHRGIYGNVMVEKVPGVHARLLKRHYNDVGAEVAISHDAWLEKEDAVTDILVMGSLYQHGEVRAALAAVSEIQDLLTAIKEALD